jgi:hypothetical protein
LVPETNIDSVTAIRKRSPELHQVCLLLPFDVVVAVEKIEPENDTVQVSRDEKLLTLTQWSRWVEKD